MLPAGLQPADADRVIASLPLQRARKRPLESGALKLGRRRHPARHLVHAGAVRAIVCALYGVRTRGAGVPLDHPTSSCGDEGWPRARLAVTARHW
jgi:hypothetical protein